MASLKLAPLFKQTVSVQCVSFETLTGVRLEASEDGDFAGKFMAPPSDELDDPTHLLGLIYPGSLGSNGWLLHTTLNPLVGVNATICSLYDVLLVVVAGSDLGADLPCWVEVACSVLTCFLCEMLVDVWDVISYGFCCYGLGLLVFPMGGGCSSAVGLIRLASLDSCYGSQQLGEALSPHDWATDVVFSVAALLSQWRVLDGVCPSNALAMLWCRVGLLVMMCG
ncbi:hypothetical protein NC652_034117 [Populus alba x Populus x berolinensis]|nr:hypothetical protein NC652_034117 [Populus alba x Populus x berolinensis]